MGLAKLCGFLAASVLPLILLLDSTEEAVPPNQTRKEYICSFPIVIRGFYPNAFKEGKPNDFNIFQVYKGPEKLQKTTESVKIKCKESCAYFEKGARAEYVIYGFEDNGVIMNDHTELMKNIRRDSSEALTDIAIKGC